MPNYEFHCSFCNAIFEEQTTIADRDSPLKESCPSCGLYDGIQRLIGAPPLLDSVQLGVRKPNATFQNRLKEIASKHGQGVKGRYGHNITEI